MAFQQPTLAPSARQNTVVAAEQYANTFRPPIVQPFDDSREWILFPHAESTTYTHTASAERSTRTAGLSRLSDFGSLNTAAKSSQDDLVCRATVGSEQEDEELDSLDEGLHAFQNSSSEQRPARFDQTGSVLPKHDGLGSFAAAGAGVQEHIWRFEPYNPRKRSFAGHHGRRSSVQRSLDAVEEDDKSARIETETRERIERWRLEHSRVLLDEIEKQTRQGQSAADCQRPAPSLNIAASTDNSQDTISEPDRNTASTPLRPPAPSAADSSESFLQRVTRRVIRDFIGIDEATLAVIFGEALPEEDETRPQLTQSSFMRADSEQTSKRLPWETRFLTRLARELGFLLEYLTEDSGAFSSPVLFNPSTSEYAGIPITQPTSSRTRPRRRTANDPPPASPSFDSGPTMSRHDPPLSPSAKAAAEAESHYASLWGIEEEPPTTAQENIEREYWERPADIKTVFRFLHKRFASSRRPSSSNTKINTSLNIATASTADSLRRAAVVRQYHPLVSRAASQWEHRHGRRSWLHSGYGYVGSSCGSQSLRRSRRGTTTSISSSSRNFWDVGGSATGSMAGGLGGWGEV